MRRLPVRSLLARPWPVLARPCWLLASLPVIAGAAAQPLPAAAAPATMAPRVAAAPAATSPAGAPACDGHDAAQLVGRVPAELEELSGLAASRRHPGIFWAHNDSDNTLVLHAMRPDGTIVASFPLRGVIARDPEDIAVGPCAQGDARSCIYLGDVGDNGRRRAQVAILKLPEPAQLRSGPITAEVMPFRYADGGRNVEALVVDPRTARLFVITKTLVSLGDVYRLDGLGTRGGGRAVRVRQLRAARDFDSYTTAADVHPRGDRMLLRTYGRVWELRSPGARAFEDVLEAQPVEVPGASQPQAEAIAYDGDGLGYLLASESAGSAIYHVACRAAAGSARR